MDETTLEILLGNVLDELKEVKEKIEEGSTQQSFKEHLDSINNQTFSASLNAKSTKHIQATRDEIDSLQKQLSRINIEHLNDSISKFEKIKIEHKHTFGGNFTKFMYKSAPVFFMLSILICLGMFSWLVVSKQEAEEKTQQATSIIKEYKDFPNTIEWNWLVAYYNYFKKIHPNDTQRYTKSNPYPKNDK